MIYRGMRGTTVVCDYCPLTTLDLPERKNNAEATEAARLAGWQVKKDGDDTSLKCPECQ